MLRHTFCHVPGIGPKTERRLWTAGLTTWDAALDPERPRRHAVARRLPADFLRASAEHYARASLAWFAERLPPAECWRLFGDFRGHCAYLDIETTGLGASDHVTTIALYDGRSVRTYVHGRDLADFVRDVEPYRLLVTYNGKAFDLPFLQRCLRCRLDQAHIDLRHVLASLGVRGGLKSCERQLGLARPGLEDVDGFVAVLLWHDFRTRQEPRALESLLAYNVQDTVNLERLMVHAYNRKLADLSEAPFAADYRLPLPATPPNPFRADPDTVRRVLRASPWLPAPLAGLRAGAGKQPSQRQGPGGRTRRPRASTGRPTAGAGATAPPPP
jgi:uncharacterized protein YprB with RNaseH-like and TPR domain